MFYAHNVFDVKLCDSWSLKTPHKAIADAWLIGLGTSVCLLRSLSFGWRTFTSTYTVHVRLPMERDGGAVITEFDWMDSLTYTTEFSMSEEIVMIATQCKWLATCLCADIKEIFEDAESSVDERDTWQKVLERVCEHVQSAEMRSRAST
ncbi:hypothetical protein LTS10_013126 [Elasticomyces elasticus]|nr:hypothetical protein LTS10_013126 [Elasticomyces elasticus]